METSKFKATILQFLSPVRPYPSVYLVLSCLIRLFQCNIPDHIPSKSFQHSVYLHHSKLDPKRCFGLFMKSRRGLCNVHDEQVLGGSGVHRRMKVWGRYEGWLCTNVVFTDCSCCAIEVENVCQDGRSRNTESKLGCPTKRGG